MRGISMLFVLTGIILFTSCGKEEGDFGSNTLSGKVHKTEYVGTDIVIREYYAPEERVYLTYGDNEIYDDWTRTAHDGSYKFTGLTDGSYTLYGYSACDSCASGVAPVFMTVELKGDHVAEDLELVD